MINDDTIIHNIIVNLRKIIRSTDLQSRRIFLEFGITSMQLLILKEIESTNPVTIGRLSKNLNVAQSTMTKIIDKLVSMGYVNKVKNQIDKRSTGIELTDSGSTKIIECPSMKQDIFMKNLEKLPNWKKYNIHACLEEIVFLMESDNVSASPVLSADSITKSV